MIDIFYIDDGVTEFSLLVLVLDYTMVVEKSKVLIFVNFHDLINSHF